MSSKRLAGLLVATVVGAALLATPQMAVARGYGGGHGGGWHGGGWGGGGWGGRGVYFGGYPYAYYPPVYYPPTYSYYPPAPVIVVQAPAPPYPPPPAPVAQARPATYTVFFDFNRSSLTPEARRVVDQAVVEAKRLGAVRIQVTGYTDKAGTNSYNFALSQERARTVRAYMVAHGVTAGQIGVRGLGEENPRVATVNGMREPQNRRVEITMSGAQVAYNGPPAAPPYNAPPAAAVTYNGPPAADAGQPACQSLQTMVDGVPHYNTACRQANGNWQYIN